MRCDMTEIVLVTVLVAVIVIEYTRKYI